MRILQVNKFYYRRGGAETYVLEVSKKLVAEGHDVAIFSMHHPKNIPSPWSKFFVSRLSFNEGSSAQKIKGAFRLLYSFEARRKFTNVIEEFKPDIIHLHNIYHQLSPSFLPIAKKYGIPVVMHLHDYKLICPNYSLYDGQRTCEDCAWPHYWRCFFKKCFAHSYLKSLLVSFETFLHQRVLHIYKKNIVAYIAPSEFMRQICIRHGVEAEKITTLYNFILGTAVANTPSVHNSFLYFGRLSQEKGLYPLLKAMARLPDTKLIIAGEGPEKKKFESYIDVHNLTSRVSLPGRLEGSSLSNIIDEAQAVVMPSVWFENMPFSLLESLARGKIVLASRIGGFPEIVKDGSNGFLCQPNNDKELEEKIRYISNLSESKRNEIATAAKESVMNLNLDNHYRMLIGIYEKAIKNYS